MSEMFAVECRIKPNPMIVNPRPCRYFVVVRPVARDEAERQIAALRAGAKDAGLPYLYRLKRVDEETVRP
jgi:hypothetical protein